MNRHKLISKRVDAENRVSGSAVVRLVDSSDSDWRCVVTPSSQSFGMNTCGRAWDLDDTGSHRCFAISHCRTQEQGASRQMLDIKGISFALGQFARSPKLWMRVKATRHQRSRGWLMQPSLRSQDNCKTLRKFCLPCPLPWTVRLKQEVKSELAVSRMALQLQRKIKSQIPCKVGARSHSKARKNIRTKFRT